MSETVLKIENLHTSFRTRAGEVQAVRGVSLELRRGEVLGIVGESGCGKSVTTMSVLKVLPENAFHKQGEILFDGRNLLQSSAKEMRKVRGKRISMIFQDPMTSLNPLMKIGRQVEEGIRKNLPQLTRSEARAKALSLLRRVHIPDAEQRYHCYPHELSGGMRQRVMVAMALSCDPEILIADEPTTALDVTIQNQILLLLREMCREMNLSVIFITHDLGVVAELCDRVVVLYGGLVMEQGTVNDIFDRPSHPYTMGLMSSVPQLDQDKSRRLQPIPGSPPSLLLPPEGCPFRARCRYARNICGRLRPETVRRSETHTSACWLLSPEAPADGNPFKEGKERTACHGVE